MWIFEDAWFQDGKLVHKRTQDVEPILDHNKRLTTHNDGYSPDRSLRRAASIPAAVVEQWMREGVNIFDPNCRDEVRRRLNDPDNRYLRTSEGKL